MMEVGHDPERERKLPKDDPELYPWHDGTWRREDPTYGRIDRDIQIQVDEMKPKSLGQRVAMENTIQNRRDGIDKFRGGVEM